MNRFKIESNHKSKNKAKKIFLQEKEFKIIEFD